MKTRVESARPGARRGMDCSLWPAVAAMGLVLAIFELTPLDLRVQDPLYDFAAQRWLVDARAPGPRLIFYDGAKAVVMVMGLVALTLAVGPTRWRNRVGRFHRLHLWVVVATLASGPALIGAAKAVTNIFCPSETIRYGGDVTYVSLCGEFPDDQRPPRRGHCFPAGHASGGFALMSLAGLARSRDGRRVGMVIGLGAGSVMGAYQMAKGAHYLSHTLVTALASWILFLVWRRVLRVAWNSDADRELQPTVRTSVTVL